MEKHNRNLRPVPWSLLDLVVIFVLTYALVYALTGILSATIKQLPLFAGEARGAVFSLIGTLIQDGVLLSLSILFLQRRYGYSIRHNLLQLHRIADVIARGMMGGFIILVGVSFVNILLQYILHITPEPQEVVLLLLKTKTPWLFLSYAVLIVIVAPIVEEIFFRGLVYTYFRGQYGVRWAIVISGLIFSAVHMSLWAFPGIFVGGMGLAYLYERSKSLYTSILAHMVWNGVVTVILFLTWVLNLTQYIQQISG